MNITMIGYPKELGSPRIQLYVLKTSAAQGGLTNDSQDTILWAHISVQMLAWGILMPLGMVFGVCCLPSHSWFHN